MLQKNKIYLGNSLEILKKIPDKSVDLVFADPPYNLQLKETLFRPDQSTVEAVTCEWDKFSTYNAYDRFTIIWLKECKRILKNEGSMGNRKLPQYFKSRNIFTKSWVLDS